MSYLYFFSLKGFIPFCIFFIVSQDLFSQYNVLGKPGLVMTPGTEWEQNRQLGLSFSVVPQPYAINRFMGDYYRENFYSFRVELTGFLEAYLNITRVEERRDRTGIGDRHMGLRFRLFKEEKHGFSAVAILSIPMGANYHLHHDAIIVGKTHRFSDQWKIKGELGYGLPVFLQNPFGRSDQLGFRISMASKESYQIRYLNGFFGGARLSFQDNYGILLEYDARTINGGAFAKPFSWLTLQIFTFEGRDVGFSIHGQFPLRKLPPEIRRNEKH
jgi:hypothetical protein